MKKIKRNNPLIDELSKKRRFYEEQAQQKGDMDDYWAKGFHQSLLIHRIDGLLSDVSDKKVLDIGCGDGRTAVSLSKKGNRVFGIDISRTRLLRAKEKVYSISDGSYFIQSYAETIPFKDSSFDLIVCTEVLEHVMDDVALIKNISLTLKDGGIAIISIPTVSLSRYVDMYRLNKPIYFDSVEHIREFAYYKIPWFKNDFITIKTLIEKFKSMGLTLYKSYGVGFELPLAIRRYTVGRFIDGIIRGKGINRVISRLPVLKNICVYTIFVLRKMNHYS